jgi:hypothetical protein
MKGAGPVRPWLARFPNRRRRYKIINVQNPCGQDMRQRGRKSSAELVTLPGIDVARTRLDPPRYLNKTERAIFVELASSAHFVITDAGLLASLAQATVMARRAARDPAKLSTWERAVRVQAMLSTKLRLTPQARCDPKSVGRQQQPRLTPAPWEGG